MSKHNGLMDFHALAVLEERRESRGVGEIADEAMPFAGGVVCRGEPGSWFNGARGAGMSGPVSRDEVRGFIHELEIRGIEPRISICPFVDESLRRALFEERFLLRDFTSVLCRPLLPDERIAPLVAPPQSLRIEPVDPSDQQAVESFARTSVAGFLSDSREPPEMCLRLTRRMARHPRATAIRAMVGDECVGAGAMEIDGELAALYGASVLVNRRGQGIQQAMLAWRLNRAAACGVSIATIGSRPRAQTERNAQRMGFALAYMKVTLVRPGPGLAPNLD